LVSVLSPAVWLRRTRAIGDLRRKLRKYERTIFLGQRLKTHAMRQDYSQAYHRPERALMELHSYLWAVPAVPTPFVGEAARPGRYGSAVINRQQFRHPREVAVPKPPGTHRIFFTGASTAFCSGAPGEDTTITGYLQSMLNSLLAADAPVCEIVNAAYPGWASAAERLWIDLRLSKLDPDIIVHFSGNNDAHWGARCFATDWMRSYHEQLFFLMADAWHRYFGKAPLTDVVPRQAEPIPPDQVARTLVENIRPLVHQLPTRGIDYLFILQPTIAETGKALSPREGRLRAEDPTIDYFSRCYRAMRPALEALAENADAAPGAPRFAYCDYSDVFDHCGADREVFLDAYHFGDRGNQIIADRLCRDLLPRAAPEKSTVRG
jgi:hypothetical protein